MATTGHIYKRGSRWWWRVRLPREPKTKSRPLIPDGHALATKNRAVAETIAKRIWREASALPSATMENLIDQFDEVERLRGVGRHVDQKVAALRDFIEVADIQNPEDITRQAIQDFLILLATPNPTSKAKPRRKGLSPKTVINRRGHIRRFCRFLMLAGHLDRNPVEFVEPPKVRRSEIVYLTTDELEKALQVATEHELWAVHVAAYTGMRLGEIMRLQWTDLRDGPGGRIIVIPQSKGNRPDSIPMHPKLGPVFEKIPREGEYVFPQHDRRTWAKMLDPIKEAVPKMARQGGGWHDLRRTVGSLLIQQGTRLEVVSKILRHRDVSTTARYYAHLDAEAGRDDLAKL